MIPFTYDDQMVAAKAIRSAFRVVIRRYGDDPRSSILADVLGLAKVRQISLLTTVEGINKFSNEVFGSVLLRDFVFSLTTTFFTHWGESDLKYDGLVTSLARANGLTSRAANAMPSNIKEELSTFENVKTILEGNEWLVPLMLLAAYFEDDWLKNG